MIYLFLLKKHSNAWIYFLYILKEFNLIYSVARGKNEVYSKKKKELKV
jgi:hypothetical protein